MANSNHSGSAYVDSTGVLNSKKIKVAGLIFTPNANFDQIILHDGDSGADPIKLHIHGATSKESKFFDFSGCPIIFQDGVYCGTLSSGATAVLIFTHGNGE